jgi:hypothetical protein
MLVCLVFLVGAGLIEGFVSPNPTFTLAARAVIGTCYMVIFVAVLSGGALRRFKMPGDSRVVAAT